jgi:hypothetical protein
VKRLVIAVIAASVVLGACSDEPVDSPEIAAKKQQCLALEAHVFRIAPESAPKFANLDEAAAQTLAESMAAALPAEDIDLCVASESDIVSCMQLAEDVQQVKRCVPTDEMLGCMGKYQDVHEKRRKCGYRFKRDGVH